jgi:hypothetical protein
VVRRLEEAAGTGGRRPGYEAVRTVQCIFNRPTQTAPAAMEWLEPFIPLIILALYFLSWLRRQSARPQRPPSAPAPEGPRAETPFEQLIRQVQQAAEEAKRAEAAERTATRAPSEPAPPPARRTLPKPAPRRLPAAEPEFREVGAFEHEAHGFGPSNPFSEEAFEHLPRGADVTEHLPGHLLGGPHGALSSERTASSTRTAEPTRQHPLVERLRAPDSARDAFALREILDAPLARRRR